MRVLTLDKTAFAQSCRRLEREVASSFMPDLVVGIATGGDYVAVRMFGWVPHVSLTLQRPTTAGKKRAGLLFGLLRRLPRRVSDLLRIAEARVLALRTPHVPRIELDPEFVSDLRAARRILVVDDAIDSGATMSAVLEAVRSVEGVREVRSAALTVTTPRPLVSPDFALWRDGVLVRFPWSNDFRQP